MKKLAFKLCAIVCFFIVIYADDLACQKFNTDPVTPEKIYGILRSQHQTSLSSEIPARIEKITLREGDRFKEGSVLVNLDCSLIRAHYQKLEAIRGAAKSKLSVEKRLLQLNSTGELDVKNAEAEMRKVSADMKAGRVRMSKCTIRAPFSGRIVEIKMGRHQFAKVGYEILRIIDDLNLEIVFMVPSNWVTWLTPGYEFQYLVDETQRIYKARVLQRGAQIDSVSRSILMIAETIRKHPELIPGMSGIVQLQPPANN